VNPDYILETKNLMKEFKGFVAVNDVSLKVRRGSIRPSPAEKEFFSLDLRGGKVESYRVGGIMVMPTK